MSASVHGEKLLTTLPICLESDQLFVFNLSKLSWEFKPFVVAVNSTFFKSPAVSSGRVSSTPKHTSTATLLLLLLMGKNTFQHWAVWWPERAAKILPPSCFFHQDFTPRLQQVLVPERFTIEACYTQLLPGPDMASISSEARSEIRPRRMHSLIHLSSPLSSIIHAQICAFPHSQFAHSGTQGFVKGVKFQLLPQFLPKIEIQGNNFYRKKSPRQFF